MSCFILILNQSECVDGDPDVSIGAEKPTVLQTDQFVWKPKTAHQKQFIESEEGKKCLDNIGRATSTVWSYQIESSKWFSKIS